MPDIRGGKMGPTPKKQLTPAKAINQRGQTPKQVARTKRGK